MKGVTDMMQGVSRGLAAVWLAAAWGAGIAGCGGETTETEVNLRSEEILAADRMWSRGGTEEAKGALAAAAENPANRFAAEYRLGILWLATDPQKALDHFARASREVPAHPGPVFLSGVALNALNRFHEADLEMKQGYEMARRRLGYALPDTGAAAAEGFQALGRKKFPAAAAAFERALEEQGELPQLWLLRGMALLNARDLEGARAAVDRALELDSGFAEARVARARMTALGGNAGAARAEVELVLAEEPNLASAHFQLGNLQLADSDFRDAVLSFWWSVLDDPTRPAAHSAVASTFSHMQLARAAMPAYRRVEAINAFLGRYYGREGFVPRR